MRMGKKSRINRGQGRIDKESQGMETMGGRRGLRKVIVYRQMQPHAARRRKSITRGLCVTIAEPLVLGDGSARATGEIATALDLWPLIRVEQLSFTWLALYRVNSRSLPDLSDVGSCLEGHSCPPYFRGNSHHSRLKCGFHCYLSGLKE